MQSCASARGALQSGIAGEVASQRHGMTKSDDVLISLRSCSRQGSRLQIASRLPVHQHGEGRRAHEEGRLPCTAQSLSFPYMSVDGACRHLSPELGHKRPAVIVSSRTSRIFRRFFQKPICISSILPPQPLRCQKAKSALGTKGNKGDGSPSGRLIEDHESLYKLPMTHPSTQLGRPQSIASRRTPAA